MLALHWTLRALERGTVGSFALAGVGVGLATAAKYTGVLMGVPLLAAFAAHAARDHSRGAARFIWDGRLAAIPAAALAGFVAGMPYAVVAAPRFVGEFIMLSFYQPAYAGTSSGLAFGPHIGNLIEMQGGFLFVLCMAGIVWVGALGWRERGERRSGNRGAGILVLLVAVTTIYAKVGSLYFHPPRYVVPLLPLLSIFAGKLAADLLKGELFGRIPRAVPTSVLGLGVLYTLVYAINGVLDIRDDDRNLAQRWVVENVPKSASVEMVQWYGINVPEGYEGFTPIPYLHHKQTFVRMVENPIYRKVKALLPWARFDDQRAPMLQKEEDPATIGLSSLLRRRPDYLIITDRACERFLSDRAGGASNYPLQSRMYREILAGRTPYRLVADFRKPPSLLRPELEFINAGVTIYRFEE
jgi:hypothetical protein